MDKVIFFKRSFLNTDKHHSNASIVCDIKDCRNDSYGGPFWTHFKLSDCDNHIQLSMDLGSIKELENTLFKLNTILDITKQFRDQAESLREDIKNWEEKKNKLEKERNDKK